MPVFTFMGSSLLRNDDQYSFQVITQTIDSVIPPLIQVSTTKQTTTTNINKKYNRLWIQLNHLLFSLMQQQQQQQHTCTYTSQQNKHTCIIECVYTSQHLSLSFSLSLVWFLGSH